MCGNIDFQKQIVHQRARMFRHLASLLAPGLSNVTKGNPLLSLYYLHIVGEIRF